MESLNFHLFIFFFFFFFFFVAFVKSNLILKITLALCTLNLKWSLLEFKFVLFLAREVVTSM